MKIYDGDIRKVLIDSFKHIPDYCQHNDTVYINELDIRHGTSRIDVAVVNGSIHGYEIKSPQDNLTRLPFQIESYNLIFDTVTIVSCNKHLKELRKMIPSWWGISIIQTSKDSIKLKNVRKARQNKNIDFLLLTDLLWKQEMIELILTQASIKKGVFSKTKNQLAEIIIKHISSDIIYEYVTQILKTRKEWKAVLL